MGFLLLLPLCSEEPASRAPSAWTFQRRRDFAQSLLEDDGGKRTDGKKKTPTEPPPRRRSLAPSRASLLIRRRTKKQELWSRRVQTQNVGRAPLRVLSPPQTTKQPPRSSSSAHELFLEPRRHLLEVDHLGGRGYWRSPSPRVLSRTESRRRRRRRRYSLLFVFVQSVCACLQH